MKHYKYIIVCILSALMSNCATEDYHAIVGQIEGVVINERTKEPIISCEVSSQRLGSVLTDSHGRYFFDNVEPGSIQLTYKCSGYQSITREFMVSAGKTVQANVSLMPMEEECKLMPNNTVLDFGNREGVTDLILKNTSSSSISYSIKCDAKEVSFDPQRGVVLGGNSSIIKVAVDRSELSEGHYERVASIITGESTIDLQIIFDKGTASRPTVSTLALEQSDDLSNAIVAKGSIIAVGSSNIIQHGFCYSTESDPLLLNNDGIINRGSASAATDFIGTITGLEYEVTYYVRAFATNQQGTSYGEVMSLVLAPKNNMVIITKEATSITSTSAKLNALIFGGTISDVSEVGFCYGISKKCENRLAVDTKNSKKDNELSVLLENLEPDTEYFFRGYGVIAGEEKYGEIMSFKTTKGSTQDSKINCETLEASEITVNSAILNGNFSVSGTIKVKEWGFYYGTNPNPTIRSVCETNSKPIAVSSKTISQKIEKLSAATTYYFQTYAIDELNKVFKGSVESFTTSRTPSIVIDYLNVSTSIGLSGKATLYPEGNTVLEAGFIYRTDGYDLSLTTNYNNKTIKVPCEIISNTITLDNETIGGYLGGGYVRAYMILVDNTIIYNGPKIYVASDLPYPR